MMRLQRCGGCGAAQYPPREFCGTCLSDRLGWESAGTARVVARTILHHSNEAHWRARLPLTLGLVEFDAGPVVVCFLAETVAAGDTVQIDVGADDLLQAIPLHPRA